MSVGDRPPAAGATLAVVGFLAQIPQKHALIVRQLLISAKRTSAHV